MNSIKDSFHPLCWDLYKIIKNALKLAGTTLLITGFVFSWLLWLTLHASDPFSFSLALTATLIEGILFAVMAAITVMYMLCHALALYQEPTEPSATAETEEV